MNENPSHNNERSPFPESVVKELTTLFNYDSVKLGIIELLLDGAWHSIDDIYRSLYSVISEIGILRIALIINEFREILGDTVIERKNDEKDITLWRINPEYIDFVRKIVKQASAQHRHNAKNLGFSF